MNTKMVLHRGLVHKCCHICFVLAVMPSSWGRQKSVEWELPMGVLENMRIDLVRSLNQLTGRQWWQ